MSVIAIIGAADTVPSEENLAPTRRRTPGSDGGVVPTGLAGYTWDGAAYCPECASQVEVELPDGSESVSMDEYPAYTDDGTPATDPNGFGVGVVSQSDEWDYPGATCHRCGRRLQTNVLVYDDGGVHPTPVIEVWDPDLHEETAEAFVLDVLDVSDDTDKVRVILAEDFRPYGTAGDVSWVPVSDVPEEYHDQLD